MLLFVKGFPIGTIVLSFKFLVLENLKKALDYYFNQSVCEVNDDEIDQFERKIESECVKILLHERPYARDLKEVTGILKLVEDIERIGDHAEDIVTFSKKLNEKKGDYNSEVLELSDIVIGIISLLPLKRGTLKSNI